MALFVCSKCQCVENSALGWWWSRDSIKLILPPGMEQYESGKGLCSECLPIEAKYEDGTGEGKIGRGKWHGKFDKRHIDDFMKSETGKNYIRRGDALIWNKD